MCMILLNDIRHFLSCFLAVCDYIMFPKKRRGYIHLYTYTGECIDKL